VRSLTAPLNIEDQTKGKRLKETRDIVVGNPAMPPNVEDYTRQK